MKRSDTCGLNFPTFVSFQLYPQAINLRDDKGGSTGQQRESCPAKKNMSPVHYRNIDRLQASSDQFERLLNLSEAADLLRLHPDPLKKFAQREKVPAVKI